MQVSPSAYWRHAAQLSNPALRSCRTKRDDELLPEIKRVWKVNFCVYGARKICYDNALAETINGLYKTELIHHRGPWKTKAALEMATLEWVAWFNNQRLMGSIGYIPPAEAEQNYYKQQANEVFEYEAL